MSYWALQTPAAPPGPPLPRNPATSHLPHLSPGPRAVAPPGRGPLCHLRVCQSRCIQGPQTGGPRPAERAELRHPRAASSRFRACGAAGTSGPLVWQLPHPSPAPVSQAASVHLSLSPSSQNTSPISGRVRLTLLMSQLHLQRPCFQIKSPSQVLGSGR